MKVLVNVSQKTEQFGTEITVVKLKEEPNKLGSE